MVPVIAAPAGLLISAALLLVGLLACVWRQPRSAASPAAPVAPATGSAICGSSPGQGVEVQLTDQDVEHGGGKGFVPPAQAVAVVTGDGETAEDEPEDNKGASPTRAAASASLPPASSISLRGDGSSVRVLPAPSLPDTLPEEEAPLSPMPPALEEVPDATPDASPRTSLEQLMSRLDRKEISPPPPAPRGLGWQPVSMPSTSMLPATGSVDKSFSLHELIGSIRASHSQASTFLTSSGAGPSGSGVGGSGGAPAHPPGSNVSSVGAGGHASASNLGNSSGVPITLALPSVGQPATVLNSQGSTARLREVMQLGPMGSDDSNVFTFGAHGTDSQPTAQLHPRRQSGDLIGPALVQLGGPDSSTSTRPLPWMPGDAPPALAASPAKTGGPRVEFAVPSVFPYQPQAAPLSTLSAMGSLLDAPPGTMSMLPPLDLQPPGIAMGANLDGRSSAAVPISGPLPSMVPRGHAGREARELAATAAVVRAVLPDVQLLCVLGSGAHGTVYKATYRGRVVALKVIAHEALPDEVTPGPTQARNAVYDTAGVVGAPGAAGLLGEDAPADLVQPLTASIGGYVPLAVLQAGSQQLPATGGATPASGLQPGGHEQPLSWGSGRGEEASAGLGGAGPVGGHGAMASLTGRALEELEAARAAAQQRRVMEGLVGLTARHPNIVKAWKVVVQHVGRRGRSGDTPAMVLTRTAAADMLPPYVTQRPSVPTPEAAVALHSILPKTQTSSGSRGMSRAPSRLATSSETSSGAAQEGARSRGHPNTPLPPMVGEGDAEADDDVTSEDAETAAIQGAAPLGPTAPGAVVPIAAPDVSGLQGGMDQAPWLVELVIPGLLDGGVGVLEETDAEGSEQQLQQQQQQQEAPALPAEPPSPENPSPFGAREPSDLTAMSGSLSGTESPELPTDARGARLRPASFSTLGAAMREAQATNRGLVRILSDRRRASGPSSILRSDKQLLALTDALPPFSGASGVGPSQQTPADAPSPPSPGVSPEAPLAGEEQPPSPQAVYNTALSQLVDLLDGAAGPSLRNPVPDTVAGHARTLSQPDMVSEDHGMWHVSQGGLATKLIHLEGVAGVGTSTDQGLMLMGPSSTASVQQLPSGTPLSARSVSPHVPLRVQSHLPARSPPPSGALVERSSKSTPPVGPTPGSRHPPSPERAPLLVVGGAHTAQQPPAPTDRAAAALSSTGWASSGFNTGTSSRAHLYRTYIVQEYCADGNLQQALRSGAFHKPQVDVGMLDMDLGSLLSILAQVASGMAYLHARGLVHGDLKSANVLLQRTHTDPLIMANELGAASQASLGTSSSGLGHAPTAGTLLPVTSSTSAAVETLALMDPPGGPLVPAASTGMGSSSSGGSTRHTAPPALRQGSSSSRANTASFASLSSGASMPAGLPPRPLRFWHAKLGDLGLARLMGAQFGNGPDNQIMVSRVGTVSHAAPETLRDSMMLLASDVYSFGVLMWELYCVGDQPFQHYTPYQLMYAVIIDGVRPTFPSHCPKPYVDLALECMSHTPLERPTFDQVIHRLTTMRRELPPQLLVPVTDAAATPQQGQALHMMPGVLMASPGLSNEHYAQESQAFHGEGSVPPPGDIGPRSLQSNPAFAPFTAVLEEPGT